MLKKRHIKIILNIRLKILPLITAILITLISGVYLPGKVIAESTSCENRFLTLINPVRSRDLWHEKSLTPIEQQYDLVQKNGFPATWLVQYDVLSDPELLGQIKSFNPLQETGVFLEVSPKLTNDARVVYPPHTPWFRPNAVFLSGYSQTDRRLLIDKLFSNFKEEFGFYPKSVGAWWIDSYSLDYLKQKYEITSALIVADQQTTDNYGVWGQWWGVPYYPSKANILTPASTLENKENIVILQWAQRDPLRAYGEGPAISNFSLQANDYIRQGETLEYFKQISDTYLNCDNKLGQITVGLETGIESIGYIGEYSNQLEYLKTKPNLKAVTMSEFAGEFARVYPEFPNSYTISYQDSAWNLTTQKRENQKLNDVISYSQNNSFPDYFIADTSEFLNRRLDTMEKGQTGAYFPYFLLIILVAGVYYYLKKQLVFYALGTLFLFSAFGHLLRSFSKYGWNIYYGPAINNLLLAQITASIAVFIILFLFLKQRYIESLKSKFFLILMPLSFGLDFVLTNLRYSVLDGQYYFGFALDSLRFIGVSVSKNLQFSFLNQDFEGFQLSAFLKVDYDKVWHNNLIGLIIFPLVHILIALVLALILKKLPVKFRFIMICILLVLWMGYLYQLVTIDPRVVLPGS